MTTVSDTRSRTGLPFLLLSLVAILFLLMSIAVQYNDPDGPLWMLLYSVLLLVTLYHLYRPEQDIRVILLFLGLLYGAGVVLYSGSFGDTSLDAFKGVGMNSLVDEKVRELWGLVICFVWSVLLLIHNNRKRRRSS